MGVAGLLFFQGLEKPPSISAPLASPAPATQLAIEQLPMHEKIQPEILPEPEMVPDPIPEPVPILEPEPEVVKEKPPPPEKPKEAPKPEPEPTPEPVAVAQEASTVEAGGNAVSPTLLQELQEMVEKAKYYPSRARRANITGMAILRLIISPAGFIQKAEMLSADHKYLSVGAKKTGAKLVGKSVSPPPRQTLAVEIPIRYELR